MSGLEGVEKYCNCFRAWTCVIHDVSGGLCLFLLFAGSSCNFSEIKFSSLCRPAVVLRQNQIIKSGIATGVPRREFHREQDQKSWVFNDKAEWKEEFTVRTGAKPGSSGCSYGCGQKEKIKEMLHHHHHHPKPCPKGTSRHLWDIPMDLNPAAHPGAFGVGIKTLGAPFVVWITHSTALFALIKYPWCKRGHSRYFLILGLVWGPNHSRTGIKQLRFDRAVNSSASSPRKPQRWYAPAEGF